METMEEIVEQPIEQEGGEVEQQVEQQPSAQDQQRQADKEYSNWLKGLKEDGDAGKYYKRLKADHERLRELQRIDPKGLDGVRSRYETLNGIAHGDKTGIDAVQSIQEALAESQTMLDAIAQGDISTLPEEQQDGVLRMAPSILDHLADSSPDAYAALLTPHFWQAIEASPLAQYYSGMIDVLNEKPPEWLTKEQLPQWTLDHVNRITNMAKGMGQWFTDLKAKADGASGDKGKTQPGNKTEQPDKGGNPQFWQQSIYPQTNAHAEETFNKELRPWAEKLAKSGIRLSDAKKEALAGEMVRGVSSLAQKNTAYTAQMKRFGAQRSPDAASVLSTFRSEFNRHAKTVMEGLIRRDYGQILEKGTKTVTKTVTPGTKPAAVQPGVKIVSVKPDRSNIDFPRTPSDWIYQNKWRMKDGSVVQYRP